MTNAPFRPFDFERDIKAVQRIWMEVGWLRGDTDELEAAAEFFKTGHTEVGTIDNRAECCVHWTPGTIQYQNETLPLGAVTAVTTSHLARKLGFAKALTARSLAAQANSGLAISVLGMFDQGFYDKVGFGTGPYVNEIQFDPATLAIDSDFRPPKRLLPGDFEAVYTALVNRRKYHGSVVLNPSAMVKADMALTEKPFGLGYFDGPGGTLSHFIWGAMEGEHGPYRINARAYRSRAQLMELLALVKSLGDQVNSFIIAEFGDFQFQDVIRLPFRTGRSTRGGAHAHQFSAYAYWQMRILDLQACLEATSLPHTDLSFNLSLFDPVSEFLSPDDRWTGVAGDYTVRLSSVCTIAGGATAGLPTLKASINAFSRLWFGIRPASHLLVTDSLQADDKLINSLDFAFNLPRPDFGWDF